MRTRGNHGDECTVVNAELAEQCPEDSINVSSLRACGQLLADFREARGRAPDGRAVRSALRNIMCRYYSFEVLQARTAMHGQRPHDPGQRCIANKWLTALQTNEGHACARVERRSLCEPSLKIATWTGLAVWTSTR